MEPAGLDQALDGEAPLDHEETALAEQDRIGHPLKLGEPRVIETIDRNDGHVARGAARAGYWVCTTERVLRCRSTTSRPSRLLR